jgi:hypothetical protein
MNKEEWGGEGRRKRERKRGLDGGVGEGMGGIFGRWAKNKSP